MTDNRSRHLSAGSYYQQPTPEQIWQAQQKEIRELSERKDEPMSAVAWCDPGNHAFKAGVRGSQSFDGTFVNDEGETVRSRVDVCPEHAFQGANPAAAPEAITEKRQG